MVASARSVGCGLGLIRPSLGLIRPSVPVRHSGVVRYTGPHMGSQFSAIAGIDILTGVIKHFLSSKGRQGLCLFETVRPPVKVHRYEHDKYTQELSTGVYCFF